MKVDKEAALAASKRSALIAPIVANIAFVMELTLVPMLLPLIQTQFGLTIGGLAWVFNAYGISVALGVLLGGWFGDIFRTTKVFGFGIAVFAAGSLLVAMADSVQLLIVGRILQGLGGGLFSPLVPLLLTRASPAKPGRVLILWGSIAGYCAAFTPLIYGSTLADQGWQIAFLAIAITALAALFILYVASASVDSVPKSRSKNNLSKLLRNHKLSATFVYIFCTYGSISYFLFRLPIWLSGNDFMAANTGLVLSVLWLTFSGMSTLLRNWVDSPNLGRIMMMAPLLIAAGVLLSSFYDQLIPLLFSSVLVGSGLACSNAPSTQLTLRFAPNGMSAMATSLDITFARLGGIATVSVLASSDATMAAVSTSVLCLVALFCASILYNGGSSAELNS
ncbi:MFS transporter [Flavimaricola marinus]|uniref:MFS transporter n=1 Tax=Flavimaricola marinus TaxID=1819565 RepID=UPI001FE3B966|nr:MFS transporter [Flavimaricola marinus]